jgi:FkbM family methyltransferase
MIDSSNSTPVSFRVARWWGHHWPLPRGRQAFAAIVVARHPTTVRVTARVKDGRLFHMDLADSLYHGPFFLGDYEPEIGAVARSLIRAGDHTIDIGANYGWYTTLFSKLVGHSGSVHAFEPTATGYRDLEQSCDLNGARYNTHLIRAAVSNQEGSGVVYTFPGQTLGHSSLQNIGAGPSQPQMCRTITLDDYCRTNRLDSVRLIKCDVEGAELLVLKGAQSLSVSGHRPIWMLEINARTSAAFGYLPHAIAQHQMSFGYQVFVLSRGGLIEKYVGQACKDGDTFVCCAPDTPDAMSWLTARAVRGSV